MAKSAFEDYPRETAVRLILLMGGAGAVLTIAGFVGHITTFWLAGSILVLFAVASWPKHEEAKESSTEDQNYQQTSPTTSTIDDIAVEPEAFEGDSLLASAKAQIELLRKELERRRKEDSQKTQWRKTAT